MSGATPERRFTVSEIFALRDMVTVSEVNGWRLRVLARNAPSYAARARTGALNVQLVNVAHRVRIVTPCTLTEGQFEIHRTERLRVRCWGCAVRYLENEGIEAPSPCWVGYGLQTWVHPTLVGVSAGDREQQETLRNPLAAVFQ